MPETEGCDTSNIFLDTNDELEGFNEIVESLEQIMVQVKRRSLGDVVNHT